MNFDKAIDILQLNQKYSNSELKKQYYSKALFYHPDKNKSEDANERFQEINEAYTFLTDYKSDKNTTYDSLFNTFINSLFNNKLIHSINKEELKNILRMCNTLSIKIIRKMSIENIVYLYNIIKTYNYVFQLDDSFIKEINNIIREKNQDAIYYVLEPTLENMYNNEIFVINHHDEKLSVPLWHSDLIYELGGEDIYVKCIPDLPENINIDKNNNLHISLEKKCSTLFNEEKIDYAIGSKIIIIPMEKLYIKKYQRYILKNQGLSIIQPTKLLDTSYKADIIFYIKLI